MPTQAVSRAGEKLGGALAVCATAVPASPARSASGSKLRVKDLRTVSLLPASDPGPYNRSGRTLRNGSVGGKGLPRGGLFLPSTGEARERKDHISPRVPSGTSVALSFGRRSTR